MLDISHLVGGNCEVKQFLGNAAVTNLNLETWIKPRGKSMLYLWVIGSGAGGGGGSSGAAGTTRMGGGSGGSAAYASLLVPMIFLPDRLYVQTGFGGQGGAGGTPGVTGGSGILTLISVVPSTTGFNGLLLASGNAAPTGGAGGNGAAGGGAGAAGTAATIASNCPFAAMGYFQSTVGSGGVLGNTVGGNGSSLSFPPHFMMNGAGAAGTTGGVDSATGITQTTIPFMNTEICPQVPAAGPIDGAGGRLILGSPQHPYFSFGGVGGGSSNANPGGNGGNGGPGMSGGGGGAGNGGGRGGDGGPGMALFISF